MRSLPKAKRSFWGVQGAFRWTPSFAVALAALTSLSLVAFLGKAYENTLRGIDSNIHAKVSMDVTSGGFLPVIPPAAGREASMPTQPAAGSDESAASSPEEAKGLVVAGSNINSYFNDHPFFYFWLNGKIMRWLGPSGWSARLLTGIFSTGCVLLTLLLGAQLHSVFFGFLSALFFLLSRDVILTGATVSLDPPMLFFILLSFCFWAKRSWHGMALAAGIGLWFKTPVVLLVYPTAVVIEAGENFLTKKSGGPVRQWVLPLGLSLCAALAIGSLVWVATGFIGSWHWVEDYWVRQFWGTAMGGRGRAYRADEWMFFRLIKNGFIPGLPFLIWGILRTAATIQIRSCKKSSVVETRHFSI